MKKFNEIKLLIRCLNFKVLTVKSLLIKKKKINLKSCIGTINGFNNIFKKL